MVTYRRGEQLCPLDDDHASPQFRRDSHSQVMTLSDREVAKPSFGIPALPHIAETGTSEIDAIECWSCRQGSVNVLRSAKSRRDARRRNAAYATSQSADGRRLVP